MKLLTNDLREIITMLYPDSEYLLLLESFSEFLEKEILPTARGIDREKIFPRGNLEKLFEEGFTSMPFPSIYGGLELPYPIYIAAMEMLGMACASTGISIAIHGTVCSAIEQFGTKEQKERYLKQLILGEKIAAFALTEPHSGSDARSMQTRASLKNGGYLLNGSKIFISNGGVADLYLIFARTEKGPSAFIVDSKSDGLRAGKNIEKLGIRGSTLTEIFLEECIVPKENLLGNEGEGFDYAKQLLNSGRITIAALSTGIAQIAFEKAREYSKNRVAFGKPISQYQMIRQKLADMATAISAARQLTYRAAWLKQKGEDFALQAAQAKLFASETALRVSDEAIQIHGGYGYTDESDIHRHWRDARMMTIGEGTSEIMRLIISHKLLE